MAVSPKSLFKASQKCVAPPPCILTSFMNFLLKTSKTPWMLKAPPLISLDLHLLVTKWNCQAYDVNIGPKLKNLSLVILGAYYRAYSIVDLFLLGIYHFQPFSYFSTYVTPLYLAKLGGLIYWHEMYLYNENVIKMVKL